MLSNSLVSCLVDDLLAAHLLVEQFINHSSYAQLPCSWFTVFLTTFPFLFICFPVLLCLSTEPCFLVTASALQGSVLMTHVLKLYRTWWLLPSPVKTHFSSLLRLCSWPHSHPRRDHCKYNIHFIFWRVCQRKCMFAFSLPPPIHVLSSPFSNDPFHSSPKASAPSPFLRSWGRPTRRWRWRRLNMKSITSKELTIRL